MPARSFPASAMRTGSWTTPPGRTSRRSGAFETRSIGGCKRCWPNSPLEHERADRRRSVRSGSAGHVTHLDHVRPARARSLAAEAVGTFALVFAGCGAITVNAKTRQLGHLGVAITFGS